jgi:hypothetical protein
VKWKTTEPEKQIWEGGKKERRWKESEEERQGQGETNFT